MKLYYFTRETKHSFGESERNRLRNSVERFLRGGPYELPTGIAEITVRPHRQADIRPQQLYERLKRRGIPVVHADPERARFGLRYPLADGVQYKRVAALLADLCTPLVPYGFSVLGEYRPAGPERI